MTETIRKEVAARKKARKAAEHHAATRANRLAAILYAPIIRLRVMPMVAGHAVTDAPNHSQENSSHA